MRSDADELPDRAVGESTLETQDNPNRRSDRTFPPRRSGFVIYYIAKAVQRSRGLDIWKAFAQLPVE